MNILKPPHSFQMRTSCIGHQRGQHPRHGHSLTLLCHIPVPLPASCLWRRRRWTSWSSRGSGLCGTHHLRYQMGYAACKETSLLVYCLLTSALFLHKTTHRASCVRTVWEIQGQSDSQANSALCPIWEEHASLLLGKKHGHWVFQTLLV